MSLVVYSSSDSDHDEDKSENKNDRVRLFPDERGNWALSIYAFVEYSSHLDTMIDDIIEIFNNENEIWKRLVEFHISLSKTFPIRFHHIESIRKCIQNELSVSMIKFYTRIENVRILTNEDGSTSFLVFNLDQHRQFSKLVEIIDKILDEHRYPKYYENPCFHVSFAYSTVKNREEKLPKDWQEKCQSVFKQYQCQPSAMSIIVDDIRLKAGKRTYQLTKSS
ncbi:unnamed protein product [Adineta steineri]|uniref:U6 snRNA phosphodiesterase 1 n=1 Tax=Adineta steineri TaxID=433720 RepID=A0A813W711_9BILA|nr:unnamed protein product [Adineta steineri]CAF3918321.1 unnamed protein product [Adineta steineri]